MQNVSIKRIQEPEVGASSMLAEMDRLSETIRRRAFDHFLMRGGGFGNDLDDWLRAERELVWTPSAEMTESEKEVTLRVQAPGLNPDDIRVTATPDSILIQGEASQRHEESNGRKRFCELTWKPFRRFNLTEAIRVDKVSATLDNGILQIVAPKSQAARKERALAVASRTNVAA